MLQEDEPLFDPTGGSGTAFPFEPVIAQQNTPAVGPVTGDRYLVGTAPTGAWSANANDIAEWSGAAWLYNTASSGDYLYITTPLQTVRWNGSAWVLQPGIAILQNGNSFGASGARIGTNDSGTLWLKTNNTLRVRIDGTTGGVRMAGSLFVGHLVTAPIAELQVRGTGITNATYAARIENSSAIGLIDMRDDGLISIGTGANVDAKLLIKGGNQSSGTTAFELQDSTGMQTFTFANSGEMFINAPAADPQIMIRKGGIDVAQLIASTNLFYMRVPPTFSIRRIADNYALAGNVGDKWYFQAPVAGTMTPTALIHVQAATNDNTDYAIKVQDSAAVLMFSIRNDGRISLPTLQVGNAGLSSGDLYVDLAANILANGDFVVGRKV